MAAVTLRNWLTGTRPVVGALGACSLMLLACSWFALAPGELGATTDVGVPAPIRITHVITPHPTLVVPRHRARVVTAARRGRRTAVHTRAAPSRVAWRRTTLPPIAPPAPQSDAPAAASPAATTTPSRRSSQPTIPTLPAPPSALPEVDMPPVTLPVSVLPAAVTTPAVALP